jgi:5'-methylthioadenosine/S-adenosylhomocysteine nucleosidase
VVILGVPAEVRDVEARLTRASAERVQGVPFNVGVIGSRDGIIVTGDAFVANPAQRDEMRRSLKASAVEMEGAAVAQVCSQLGVPFIVIRAITDNADGGTIDDYRTNLDAASRNAATLTLAVIADVAVRTK